MQHSRPILLIIAALASVTAWPSDGSAAGGRAPAELILMHLPTSGSRDYDELRQIAGTSTVLHLELTGGELWRIPRMRLAAFTTLASAKGVEIIRVDGLRARLLSPMIRSTQMTDRQKSVMAMSMAESATMGMSMMNAVSAPLAEYELKRSTAAMQSGETGTTVRLQLAPGTAVTARPISIAPTATGYVWSGEVVGSGEPLTFLWSKDGRLTGTVTLGERMFVIRPMGGSMHAVIEQSAAKMPQDHAPAPPAMLEEMGMREDPLVRQGDASMLRAAPKSTTRTDSGDMRPETDSDITITVLVAYTAAAARHYDDITRDLVELSIEEANQSFRMSGIDNVRLKLVRSYQSDYVETGTHFDHVWRLADRGDGMIEDVHGARDRVGADVAVLIVDDANGCGLSTRVNADAEEAFAVVHHGCAASMYSLAHEIGHLIGARHDPALDSHEEPFAYGHGYVNGKKWRTMMSYKDACNGCMRLPVWSSPTVIVKHEPAGNELANNARVIREGAARVARFRKDPATAGQASALTSGADR